MKTTNLLWILCLSLSASLAAVTATMLRVLDENRNLRREIHTARADLDKVGDEVKALEEAQERGEVTEACRPEAVGHFLVASLEGAILLTKLTKDIGVMDRCVEEMNHYLSLYETNR